MIRRIGIPRTAERIRAAFTLVELLVVIAIIGTLVGLLLPAIQSAREAGRRMACSNNLKQVGLAITNYVDTRKAFPKGRDTRDNGGVSWSFRILPFLEQGAIHDALDETVPAHHPNNSRAMRTAVATYFCPSRRGPTNDRNFDNNNRPPSPDMMGVAAGGDFAAVAGTYFNYAVGEKEGLDPKRAGAIFTMSNVKPQQVTDGLSKTFAVGERHLPTVAAALQLNADQTMVHYSQGDTAFFAADTPHTQFRDTSRGLAEGPHDTSNIKFGSMHPGVSNFVFLDGHVEAIPVETERAILRWYCAIGDGNDPTEPPGGGDDDPT